MINIGIVGFGYWGPNLVRNFSNISDCRVLRICDINPDRLVKASLSYPSTCCTTDYNELINDKDVDAIVIVTPVSTHYELAKKVLRAGKHVLIEKPMTCNSKEAKYLINLSKTKKKILMIDHTFVYTGAVRKIKEIIQNGELGEIYYFDSVRANLGMFQKDINVIWDLAVHDFSIMDFVLDKKPVSILSIGKTHFGEFENMAYITSEFEGNTLAHFHVNWLSPIKIRRILICGSKKMLVYDDIETIEKVRVYDKGVEYVVVSNDKEKTLNYGVTVQYRSGDMFAPKLDTTEALKLMCQEFIDSINENRKPLTDGTSGLRIVKLLEAADISLKRKGMVIGL